MLKPYNDVTDYLMLKNERILVTRFELDAKEGGGVTLVIMLLNIFSHIFRNYIRYYNDFGVILKLKLKSYICERFY